MPEREELGTTGLLRLNVSVERAVTTVLGCLPALRRLREELLRCLPTFNVERFDRLEEYALALLHAQVLHRGRVPRRSLTEQARELAELRERLLADARSLASHGLLREEGLQLCKRSRGYRALADDVFLLVELFREQWSSIEQRTPASMELLQQASRLSLELLRAVGARQHGPAKVSATQLVRQQAFTLLFRAYDEARRAAQYLQRERGGTEELAPAFYTGRAGRKGRRRRVPDEDTAAAPAVTEHARLHATSPAVTSAQPVLLAAGPAPPLRLALGSGS